MTSDASQQTDIYDIANRLWETADELRANSGLKASEYSVPVLGRLVESGVLAEANGKYVFTRDHLFNSPSAASGTVMGRSSNGHFDWILPNGEALGSLRLGDDVPPESL